MKGFSKTARSLWIMMLVLITAFALYIPVQEYYGSESMDERYLHKGYLHFNVAVLKNTQNHSKPKSAGTSVPLYLMMSVVVLQQIPRKRLPYRPIIPLRLRLLLLYPIKYTSKFV
ncbi:hypothetical protein [Paenibacillus sp. JCM 10914]|uniref:hypothetical protein n=1 Tax=Paenibacillus sp. JCM 10914 TaxID=1236974 RepID=UPI00056879DF|nr:hypothetical protein [Paenibacillus sp. JCM 10914]